ncbi:MAG: hypothetical protein J6D12_04475 [Peptostreptococcaceae bacterium]|nr:hypothetical protein [Peptostreptococcaceae bacterium]
MATPVEKIFTRFLSQIEDESWLEIEEEILIELMYDYLVKSIVEFNVCKKDLTIDFDNDEIVSDLSEDEVLILAFGMVIHYLTPKILREENLQQMVTSSDFSKLSNANMLDKLIKLRVQVRNDYQMYLHKYELKDFEGFN